MPTNRTRRTRRARREADVIAAIRSNVPVDYSSERYSTLLRAHYFTGYYILSKAELERIKAVLDEWRPLHEEEMRLRRDGGA